MRFIRMIGVCVGMAAAAGGALASASFANPLDPEGFGPLAASPFSALARTAPSASVSPLLRKEIAMLTNQGISPARAWEAIDVQGKVAQAGLSSKLQAAMAGAYAGMWFEPAAAQSHVGVTSPASRRAAEEVIAQEGLTGHVTVTPVRSTAAQLVATQHRWNRKLADLFAREEVETGIELHRNAVVVTLSSSVPSAQRASLKREAAGADVNVFLTVVRNQRLGLMPQAKTACKEFKTSKAYCNPSITPGVTIQEKKGASCTAGPVAIPKKNKKIRVLLTAGHCINEGGGLKEKWLAFNKEGEASVIGLAEKFVDGGLAEEKKGDFGQISIEAAWQTAKPTIPVFAVTAEWKQMNKKKEETSYPVKAEKEPEEKAMACHVGQTSGESCGEIKALSKMVGFGGGIFEEGLAEVAEPAAPIERLIGEGGDSGGPWLTIETNNEALIEGTHVGVVSPTCVKVAKQKGRQFFTTEANCLNLKVAELETNEGEWERKLRLIFQPLTQPVPGAGEGPMEAFELELLTTANESRAKELELEEKETKEHKEKEEKEEHEKEGNPLILPTPTASAPLEFTATSGKTILESANGSKIECKEDSTSGDFTGVREGTVTIDLHGCDDATLKVACESKGDAKETILASGNVELVDLEKAKLTLGFEVGLSELHLECISLTVVIKGSLIGEVSGVENGKKTKTGAAIFKQEKGKQAIKECHLTKKFCEGKKFALEASLNGGAFEEAGLETEEKLTFAKEAAYDF